MKKSLLNILTLALSVVNLALLLVIIFAIVPTMNKTDNLITQICSVIDLELENSYGSSSVGNNTVALDKLSTYDLDSSMTLTLAPSSNGSTHYAVVSVTLVMDTTNEDYATYGGDKLTERVSLIKSTIRNVFARYTKEQAEGNDAAIREEILTALRDMYKSDFIYDVQFSELLFQ